MIRYIYIVDLPRPSNVEIYHIISYNLSTCEVKLSISLLVLNTHNFTHKIISFAMVLFFCRQLLVSLRLWDWMSPSRIHLTWQWEIPLKSSVDGGFNGTII